MILDQSETLLRSCISLSSEERVLNCQWNFAEDICFAQRQMESSLDCIEASLRKLELCPGAKLAIWPYGAIKVDKSNVTGIGNITKYRERKFCGEEM